jgi:hypothetical protein
MFTVAFLRATGERAVFTFAEVVLALAGTDYIGMLSLDWPQIFAASGVAAGLSVAKSVVAGYKDGNPSAINAEATVGGGKHVA